ncbi:Astra associated protein 1 Asa1 [Coemansia spiralis]|uniref:ASTRA-associated protein 1 n=2 Tax=Coemansia TaxID=4863 RepID=A0A9W8FZ19_9FUNG|nr:Astra associated protein 1 Asa1 [Coemansia umbellata]KAJ2623385.1 Astra associated protein 1 Asa1 [Coemansia sp. RSA 1358]KAJ2672264.1 Astra associated protein 1 Asa1 [Coemansia spiralis]
MQPEFVFRGHQAAVNCVRFFADDRFMISGDQDGHLIVWNMLLKRQMAKAQAAHTNAILAVCGVGADTIISQGRDNRLCIWKLDASEFNGELELVKTLNVDSMSFCKFSLAINEGKAWISAFDDAGSGKAFAYELSSDKRVSFNVGRQINSPNGDRQDSPMCLKLEGHYNDGDSDKERLVLLVGYESTVLQCFDLCIAVLECSVVCRLSVKTLHTEPIMSMDYDIKNQRVYTCAADNRVCCIVLKPGFNAPEAMHDVLLRNAGSAEIRYFSSLELVAVAGWDYTAHLYTSQLDSKTSMRFHRAALTSVDLSTQSQAYSLQITEAAAQQRWRSRPRWLAVASRDARISLWNIDDVTCLH